MQTYMQTQYQMLYSYIYSAESIFIVLADNKANTGSTVQITVYS